MESNAVERYSRQMLMPSFGVASQQKLQRATAVIVGCGGLGCPAALYLAGAGIGRLVLVDKGDRVERSNLHRQIGHSDERVGVKKTESLRVALAALNPLVDVEACDDGLTSENAQTIVAKADVVLDCSDNVPARYLTNDACVLEAKPLVSGSAIGLEGQLTVYHANKRGDGTACYRCIFPDPPPAACVGQCDTAGVIGPVPGVIGTLQALEAIKLITEFKFSEPLRGRLLLFDGAESHFRHVKLRGRKPDCRSCGRSDDPIRSVRGVDYDSLGRIGANSTSTLGDCHRVAAQELREALKHRNTRVVDVRSKEQFAMCKLPQSINIPISELASRVDEVKSLLPSSIFVVCRRGNDSQSATKVLLDNGVPAKDVVGGLTSWRTECDSAFPYY